MNYGAIEAGGTKFVCAVADENMTVRDRITITTTTPKETFDVLFKFFDQYELASIGVGSFGPIDVNQHSDHYGYITSTPKKNWQNVDFVGRLKDRYSIPVAWTTDVNASAYGELKKGAGQDVDSLVYMTVGTGIGAGVITNSQVNQGYQHPEAGHMLVRRHPDDTEFQGVCPYHSDCLEGLASGPAIEARWGRAPRDLTDHEKVWEIEAYYLAQALYNIYLTTSAEKLILGGGVMHQNHLLPLVKTQFENLNRDYVTHPPMADFITTPGLGDDAGITGCFQLAHDL